MSPQLIVTDVAPARGETSTESTGSMTGTPPDGGHLFRAGAVELRKQRAERAAYLVLLLSTATVVAALFGIVTHLVVKA